MLHPALPRKSRPLLAALLLLAAGTAHAAEIHVVSSGGFAQAYRNLAPAYERASGDRLLSAWGPSMGSTSNAIPARLARGEQVDVVIMVGDALDKLMQEGRLVPGSKVVLAQSPIACAVRHGAAKPDISTIDGLRSAFLQAQTVAYSDSASGEYIERQMQGKAAKIPATPVGEIIARGQADFGCQQRSELMPVEGIDIVGLLPAQVQQLTEFSAALVRDTRQPDAARALLRFLAAPASAAAIAATGLQPASALPPAPKPMPSAH
ncbi:MULTISPECIES: substrate-binding domain-containing protein [unclassified Janthinobacterium]|uniref:substrate-binding domain-containing protein n=1 Tax=unclassified Janthinobacterium TaxID=2610881 RepID=UPI000886DAE5|nr:MULTISPECIES: substrate-binding domain-containing protein [unclassified Janthinobacterium]SDA41741.1 molybdate transport system substrate-binding protein [Janthinobacterium sp. 551a]SFA86862.1 molybdate transport system substrate-binding protein [Janthinobacterium sp. 344]